MKAAILIGVLLLFGACTSVQTEEYETARVELTAGSSVDKDYSKVYDLRLLRDKEERVKNSETLNEEFFPSTLFVNKGDTVRISLLTGKASYVSINQKSYGMKAGSLDFTPENAGNYYIVCEDCEDKATAIIRVV